MAGEALGTAIIEITPDFSQFTATLTRGLQDAVKAAEKSATISLNIDVNAKATQGVEKSFSNIQDTSSALGGDLKQINTTLNQVSGNINNAAKSIQQASAAMQDLAANSNKAGQSASFITRVFESLGSIAVFAKNVTQVIANISAIATFGKSIGNVVDRFQALNAASDNTNGKLKNFGKALADIFVSDEDRLKFTAQISKGISGFGNVLDVAGTKLGKNKAATNEAAAAQAAMNKIFGTTDTVVREAATAQDQAAASTTRFSGVIGVLRNAVSAVGVLNPFKGLKESGDAAVAQAADTGKKIAASAIDAVSGAGSKAPKAIFPKSAIDESVSGLNKVREASTATANAAAQIAPSLGGAAAGGGIIDSLRARFEAFRLKVEDAGGGIKGFISVLTSTLSGGLTAAKDRISSFIETLKGIGNGLQTFGKVGDAVGGGVSKLSGFVTKGIEGLKGFASSANGAELAAAGLATGGIALAGVIGSQLVSQLGNLVQQGIAAASTIQTLQISLKGIFQSTDAEAKQTFGDIQKFSALTPFTLETATSSVIKLKASFQSFTAKDALSVLKDISSAAAATGGNVDEAVSRAVLAITQIGARGKLSAQDLQQFADAIPAVSRVKVFDEIAKSLGKTRTEVQKLAESGGISSAIALPAILEASRKVPGAADALIKQSKTFQGALSTVKDNFSQLLGNAFLPFIQNIAGIFSKLDPLFAAIKPAVNEIAKALGDSLKNFAPTLAAIVVQFANFLAAVAPLLPVLAAIVNIMELPFESALALISKGFQFLSQIILVPIAQAFGFLSGIFTTIIGKVGPFVNFVVRLAAAFVEIAAKVVLFLAKFTPLGALISFIITKMGGLQNIVSAVTGVFSSLGDILSNIKNSIVGAFGTALDFVKDKIKSLVDFAAKIPGVGRVFKELKKSLDDTGATGAFKDLTGATKQTSTSFDDLTSKPGEVAAKLKAMQPEVIDLTQDMGKFILVAGNFGKVLNQIGTDALAGTGGIKGIRDEFAKLGAGILAPLDPFNQAISSAEALKNAKAAIAPIDRQLRDLGLQQVDAQKQLADLQLQRKELQADTTKGAREEADALEKIKSIENQIRDIQEERDQIIHDEQNRERDFQPTLAKFDDDAITSNINLVKAKRAVEDAQKAINDAQKAGLVDQSANLNLSGLSLDQIRSKLANARFNLSAQQAAKDKTAATDAVTAARTKEDLQNNLLEATIGVHNAETAITKNAQDKAEFLRQSTIAQREFNEKIAQLAVDEGKANRDKIVALIDQGKLLRGEIGYKKDIKDLNKQITDQEKTIKDNQQSIADATKNRADAVKALAEAELQAKIDSATALGNTAEVVRLTQQLFDLKRQNSGLDAAANTAAQTAVDLIKTQQGELASLQNAVKAFQDKNSVQNQSGVFASTIAALQSTGLSPADALKLAANALSSAAQGVDVVQKNLAFLSRVTGHPIPLPIGAEGGIYEQATTMIIGEAGREVLLPLTRPGRLAHLLSQPGILPPILAALPRISLANATPAPSIPQASITPSAGALFAPKAPLPNYQEKDKERVLLAEEIAKALLAAGIGGSSVEIHAPVTVQTPGVDALTERAIVNRIMKELNGRL